MSPVRSRVEVIGRRLDPNHHRLRDFLTRTAWAPKNGVACDAAGYILTGPDLLNAGQRPAGRPLPRDPFPLETSFPGLLAAGDVRHGSTTRVAGAVGDGAMAVALAHRRLAEIDRGT